MQDKDTPEIVSGTNNEKLQRVAVPSDGFTPETLAEMTNDTLKEMFTRGLTAMDMMEGQMRVLLNEMQDRNLHKASGKPFDAWVKQEWHMGSRRIFQLLEEGAVQAKLLETATGPTVDAVKGLSGRGLRALKPLAESDPEAAIEVVAKAVETGQTVQQVMAPTKAGPAYVDPRGPEPAPGFARRMWSTACRSCGHYAERHPRALCLDCQCQRYSGGLDEPSVTSGDTSADAEPVTEEGSESVILGDMRWLQAATNLQAMLNSPEAQRGIEELATERPKAEAARERLGALIVVLREAQEALLGLDRVELAEPVGVEA